ncbi:hypothetical protein TNCV_1591841 [Trichonephila clavipes]|nr:hypothetical protein TNCV_1591841 [Trichonephila clavipes]
MFDFHKGRDEVYRDCSLSYRSIAARNGRDLITHVAGIVRTFLDTKNVWIVSWPARSPDLSPIENAWSMVAEPLARNYKQVTTVDELWHYDEAAWASEPVHDIQFLLINDVITARGGCSGY